MYGSRNLGSVVYYSDFEETSFEVEEVDTDRGTVYTRKKLVVKTKFIRPEHVEAVRTWISNDMKGKIPGVKILDFIDGLERNLSGKICHILHVMVKDLEAEKMYERCWRKCDGYPNTDCPCSMALGTYM